MADETLEGGLSVVDQLGVTSGDNNVLNAKLARRKLQHDVSTSSNINFFFCLVKRRRHIYLPRELLLLLAACLACLPARHGNTTVHPQQLSSSWFLSL